MQLTLSRYECAENGIFSHLYGPLGLQFETLEHAYPQYSGSDASSVTEWIAKIPCGSFAIQRGNHRLHGMTEDFETFEVLGVPGHKGLLFHWGNFNQDSEGCILLGRKRGGGMVTESRMAFAEFMAGMHGVDAATLIVK